jgi:hypothetical protein
MSSPCASSEALDTLVNALTTFVMTFYQRSHFILGLDEAQQASRMYPHSFISSTNPNKFRSIIREVVKVFTKSPIKLIVSGTGLSLPDLEDAMASGVSKSAEAVQLFHKLGMFDTWPKLKSFLEFTSLHPFSNHVPGVAYNNGCGNIFRDGESTSSFSTKRVSLVADIASPYPLWNTS